ncbi:histidine kinase [Nocardiopsis terrae]|uniref:histidine kinase n=1 Tax=Nocardiopsis terrae TaxID=372655 RepID=A0ABR9HEJ8_9ACTN|nr:nitrate- and nitrite sensing domain-containing protein [Nocardiopsis terrae]MBE1457447.1 signal transduction histidine kinase [Nocardiopsis terrae]GHC92228.1 histidine kinase [Nocardiopsis terrae]
MRRTHASTRTIRGQLTRIVLIPSLCFLALWLIVATLGTIQAAQLMSAVSQAKEGTQTLSRAATELRAERRLSMVHLGIRDSGDTSNLQDDLDEQRESTDGALGEAVTLAERLRGGRDDEVNRNAAAVTGSPDELAALRAAVDDGSANREEALFRYGGLLDSLTDTATSLLHTTEGGENLTDAVLTRELLAAREDYAAADALLAGVIPAGRMTYEETAHFTFLTASYRATLGAVTHAMHPSVRARHEALLEEEAWTTAEGLSRRVVTRPPVAESDETVPGREPLAEWNSDIDVEAEEWDGSSPAAALALGDLARAQTERTVDLAWSAALLRAALGVAAAAVTLLGGVAAIALVSRSSRRLTERLACLREQILDRDADLPDIIDRAQRGSKVDVVDELPPLDEEGDDEIGQVAEAFDSAQITAVEAAVRQAEIRRGANRAFLGIAFRNQTLVQRQLRLLDEIEYNEQDPEALRQLFRLDHLATRARRYADNLIILGGGQSARRWRQPRPLVDVLRAAIAETEDFDRVRLMSAPRVLMHGQVVADIVHLLAELVENATQFSPAGTPVDVRCSPVGGGLVVEIEDRGLGMSEQGYAAAERTLTRPPEFDVMALPDDPRLGLFVVARLAERHGVRVWLNPSPYGGTLATALIPDSLLEPADAPLTVTSAPVGAPAFPGALGGSGPQGRVPPPAPQGPFPGSGPRVPSGTQGTNGLPGPWNQVGPSGPQGPFGNPGEQGHSGPRHRNGVPGPQGPFGHSGSQGPHNPPSPNTSSFPTPPRGGPSER